MDLIIYNGIVKTMDKERPQAQAVAVKDGKIAALGSSEEILNLAGEGTKRVDLEGRLMVPGFNDSHLHNAKYGIFTSRCDLSGCRSLKDLQEQVGNFIDDAGIGSGRWVIGRGWNQDLFDIRVFPTKEDLDAVSIDHPIVLFRCCSHAMVVNSKALEVLGIDENTPQVDGGEFSIESGLFTEKSEALILGTINDFDVKELKIYIKRACRDLLSQGITSIQSDDFSMSTDCERIVDAHVQLAEAGELPVRISQQCLVSTIDELHDFIGKGVRDLNIKDFYRIGPIKILSDGSLGARTAYLGKPYADDPSTRGLPLWTEEQMEELVVSSHLAGYPVAVHCIGDEAARIAIRSVEKAQAAKPDQSIRHGIIHCQIHDQDILEKYRELDLLAYVQPIFLDYDLHIVEERVGKDLAKTSYNFKTFLDLGVHMSLGTDSPVERFDPIPNLYCAVTRQDKTGCPPGGFYSEQRLTLDEALYCYTHGSAYCTYEEDRKGLIKEGYFADFAVLSENLYDLQETPEKFLNVKVDMTVVDGKVVFERNQ